jgi:hypothetical protein
MWWWLGGRRRGGVDSLAIAAEDAGKRVGGGERMFFKQYE